MYILAKETDTDKGVTIHGVTDDEKVLEAWMAADGLGFNINLDDPIQSEPYLDIAADDTDEE